MLLLSLALLLTVAAADEPFTSWRPGAEATARHTEIVGAIESPRAGRLSITDDGITVSGWAVDRYSAARPDQVQVFDGSMQTGRLLAEARPYISRQDVAWLFGSSAFRASGFEARIPSSTLDPGQHQLQVYAHFPFAIGWWWSSVQVDLLADRPQQVLGVACVPATPPDGESGFEVTVTSPRVFPVRNELVVLKIGSVTSLISRYSDGGDLHTLTFSLSTDDFAQLNAGDPIVVQYGVSDSPPPNDRWSFEPFDPSLTTPC